MAGGSSSTPWGNVASQIQDPNKGFFNLDSEVPYPTKSRSFKDVLSISAGDILPSLTQTMFNGLSAILISNDEVLKLASPFRFTMVGKFGVWRPNLDAIRAFFGNLKLSVLHALGLIFGWPLQTDQATASRTRPSVAQVLVEVDITKKHAKKVLVGSKAFGYLQKVEFKKVPDFCNHCKAHGHAVSECFKLHHELKKVSNNSTRMVGNADAAIEKAEITTPVTRGENHSNVERVGNDPIIALDNIVVLDKSPSISPVKELVNNEKHSKESEEIPNIFISIDSMLNNVESPNLMLNTENIEKGKEYMEECEEGEYIPSKNLIISVDKFDNKGSGDVASSSATIENGKTNEEEGSLKMQKKKKRKMARSHYRIPLVLLGLKLIPNVLMIKALIWNGPLAFRFQNMWINHANFLNVVANNWHATVFPDNNIHGMARLWAKLSRLKQLLRWWNKHVFKNIFDNIKEDEDKVLAMDKLFLENPSSDNLSNLDNAKLHLFYLQNQEEIFWNQRASASIILEGDRNTSFFHALANNNRIKSHIQRLVDNQGCVYDKEDSIVTSSVEYSNGIFNATNPTIPISNSNVIPKLVGEEDNLLLTQLPMKDEIWNTIKDINGDFVAGPDDFTTKYFVKSWDIIKIDVVEAVHDFFSEMVHDINVKGTGGNILFKLDITKANYNLLANHFWLSTDIATAGKLDRIVIWLKPSFPYVKLNTDGFVGVNSAGMDSIIRNYFGNPIAAFSRPLNFYSVLTAELLGLSYGLDLCLRLGFHHVNIEVDSKLVIHVISDNNAGSLQNFYTIRKIKMTLSMLTFNISHIYREGNVCVDWLANFGSQSDTL
ncbi:hypothetical protein KFK09_003018 [Dendrobium nobile]|uniref:RNase H type-1 domain-containing protein n=1 Tax=Dendrobium nobile TaxID=94219 RepID=A0A8T3C5B7_DENNO|nr:hypothetical protein KFK09_003018 [Dendrobium nobile]